MPALTRSLTPDDVRRFVDERVFTPRWDAKVGIELEWVTRATGLTPCTPDAIRGLLPDALPGESRITFEPGGQLELSGPPRSGIASACRDMAADMHVVRSALAPHGIELVATGVDPHGPRPRVVDAPRYRAMEHYFDAHGPAGRTMMCNTASIQVNLDIGSAAAIESRWQRAHDLGPVLAAAFANSPLDASGRPTGWRSSRLAVWQAIDPARTNAAYVPGLDARSSWTRYTLDAPVMMIRSDSATSTPLDVRMTFAEWIAKGHELGWPTLEDFDYHLTTLFPPIRPRGWLEFRMIDALPDEWWPVAVAVAATLLDDAQAADAATRAIAPTRGCWIAAAQDGLADTALRAAADACFTAVLEALPRLGTDAETVAAAASFHDRFVARGRCPADDLLRDWNRLQAATA
ncbi:MAG: ergothioneine biosynthesis glutamate--cysteine ligase EgtA [Acidimicrobiia bacterium]